MAARHIPVRGWHLCLLWAVALAVCAPAARANTTVFTYVAPSYPCNNVYRNPCEDAGWFGVLVGANSTLNLNGAIAAGNPRVINGELGVGTSSVLTASGGAAGAGEVWSGPVDFATASTTGGIVTSGNCPTSKSGCSVPKGDNISKVTVADGVVNLGDTTGTYNVLPGVTSALAEVTSVSNYWQTQTADYTLTKLGTTGNGVVTLGSGTSGVFIYDVKSIDFTSTSGLLLDFATGSLVIINDTGSAVFGNGNGGWVSVEGGVIGDEVLFNMTTTSGVLTIDGGAGAAINADFIVKGSYNVSHATLDGRLLGWSSQTGTLGAAFDVNAPSDVIVAPEPEDWLLLVEGLAAITYFSRKQWRLKRRFPLSRRFRDRMKAEGSGGRGCAVAVVKGTAVEGGGEAPTPSDSGIPPPRGGGGGSGGIALAREP